jgi:hypothetical protein
MTYFLGLEIALRDMSRANVQRSMIGSHTAINGLKKVLESEITVESMDFVLVWWKIN